MSNLRLSVWYLGLLFAMILTITTTGVWASNQQQSVYTAEQLQAVQAAVKLLMVEDQNELYYIYLPLIDNFRICVGCELERDKSK